MKMTIKSKIIISFCSLVVCILISQIIFNKFYAKEYFINQNIISIENLYDDLVSNYSDDPEILYALTIEEDNRSGVNVQIFSSKQPIYSSRNIMDFSMNPNMSMLLKPIQYDLDKYSSIPTAHVVASNNELESVIQILGKIEFEGENRYISLSMTVESIDRSIDIFTRVSMYINLVILFTGIIITVLLARGLTKPIIAVERITKKLQNLDFSTSVNENVSTVELASLAKSINSMSKQLESSMNELQDANEQLQKDVDDSLKLEMMTKQFIANVSHEMKTPIALLQIHCDNLKNKLPGINVDEYYETILDESIRLNKIVNDMLNVSTLENGLLKMDFKKYCISDLVRNVCKSMEPMLSIYEFIVEIEDNLYCICDDKHILEALRNYINNAVSHTNEGDKIFISVYSREESIVVSVYNEGSAISDKDIEKIWQGFYKSSESRTREKNVRAGLGLYIVKSIIHQHKGECLVENKEDGVEFSFKLKKED